MNAPMSRYYFYRMLDAEGRTRSRLEKLPATDIFTARLLVEQRHNATVLTLRALPALISPVLGLIRLLLRRAIPLPLLAEFLHSLGMMLKSGLPVDAALQDLADDTEHRELKRMIAELVITVRSGNSLSSGLEWHADLIPMTVRSLVAIGEQSGNLDRVLLDAAAHLKRMISLRQDTSKALIYPAFVVTSILGAALFWIYYVLPDLSDIFRQMGAELPPLTLSVMNGVHHMRSFLADYGSWMLAGGLMAGLLLVRTEAPRRGLYWLAYHLPVSKVLVRTSAMAFISEYLALLVAAGINLPDSLGILENTTRNSLYRQRIREVHAGVMRGNPLSQELARAQVFPPLMVRLVGVGEQSGTLDTQLRTLADEYRNRLNHTVSTLAEIIKPAVLILAGGLFVFVVVVFLLPVYDLIAQSTQLR